LSVRLCRLAENRLLKKFGHRFIAVNTAITYSFSILTDVQRDFSSDSERVLWLWNCLNYQ
jgi:hypothetical protein